MNATTIRSSILKFLPKQQCLQNRNLSYYEFPVFVGAQHLLEATHYYTHLPWWATIACTTVLLRSVVTIPMSVRQNTIAATMEGLQTQVKTLTERRRAEILVKAHRDNVSDAQVRVQVAREIPLLTNKIYKKYGVSMEEMFLLPWTQLPLWITVSLALRNVSGYVPAQGTVYPASPGITTEGLLWFSDLSIPDPYYIIPMTLFCSNLLNIEINTLRLTGVWRWLTPVLRVVTVGVAFVSTQVPAAISIYWCTSSLCGLTQNILLRLPKVRGFLRIPRTSHDRDRPIKHVLEALRDKFERYAILKKIK